MLATRARRMLFDPPTNPQYFFERILCQSSSSFYNFISKSQTSHISYQSDSIRLLKSRVFRSNFRTFWLRTFLLADRNLIWKKNPEFVHFGANRTYVGAISNIPVVICYRGAEVWSVKVWTIRVKLLMSQITMTTTGGGTRNKSLHTSANSNPLPRVDRRWNGTKQFEKLEYRKHDISVTIQGRYHGWEKRQNIVLLNFR